MRNSTKSIRFTLFSFLAATAITALLSGCGTYVIVRNAAPSSLPNTPPPPLPDYGQPFCPGPGYLWVPGYWAYGPEGYFWVSGMWEMAPGAGLVWTPGYWSWSDGVYIWHPGYWGRDIGFYGGIDYGYGYTGAGYFGGYWNNGNFYYNSAVTNVNAAVVHTTYTEAVVNANTAALHVSYNGGIGGTMAQPTSQELLAAREPHFGPTANQIRHQNAAAGHRAPDIVSANQPRNHPAYLQALSELRFARAHLEKLTPNEIIDEQEQHAIGEIDAALREIRAAAIDDGKDLNDHPVITAGLSRIGRYPQALELLRKAEADINREEDDPSVRGLQRRALMHVNAAEETVTAIMHETHQHHADHPAYLQALSELRFARAHLEKLTPNEIIDEQEQHAIGEIDAALREIRAAAIDDGKDLNDHPVITAGLSRIGRYPQALELLRKAEADINREEDDPSVRGLQRRALMHVNAAEETVTAIMHETHQHHADHPAYLQALSELRFARAHLEKLTPNEIIDEQEQHAIGEIDAALREIRAAAIDDGKDLNDHPVITAGLSRIGRYPQALELLRKAEADINREEDDPSVRGLQRRALMHVNAAEETVTAIMHETHQHHADHPAYLQALSELRFARAHLDRSGPDGTVNEKEKHAIAEIDAAIKEIKAAAIDDGKDLNDHPEIDVKLIKADRYHKALELLAKASQDLKHEENDRAAQGLQHRALAHIENAEKAVHEVLDAVVK